MNTTQNYMVVLRAKYGVRFYAVQARNVEDAIGNAIMQHGGGYGEVVSVREVEELPAVFTEHTA